METEYDVVIVGTNIVQSVAAAALARAGKKVLIFDEAKVYGGENATLSLSEFQDVLRANEQIPNRVEIESSLISTFSAKPLEAFECLETVGTPPTSTRLSDFNLDLLPYLVFSRGTMCRYYS